eukprot:4540988-Pyramimonas_sp.AAC.1
MIWTSPVNGLWKKPGLHVPSPDDQGGDPDCSGARGALRREAAAARLEVRHAPSRLGETKRS